MKNIILIVVLSLFITACGNTSDNYKVQINANKASESLDLTALGALVKQAKTAAELEELINRPLEQGGLANGDLDNNGEVDFIRVQEFGNDLNKGFSLTVDLGENNIQELTTITIEKTGSQANVNIAGNSNIYGSGHVYHSILDVGDVHLLNYLWNNHPYYVSPYYYNSYPTYYVRPRVVPYTQYVRVVRERPVYRTIVVKQVAEPIYKNSQSAAVVSPNKDKVANNIKAVLSDPTAAQKTYQDNFKKSDTNKVSGGAFGNMPTVTTGTPKPSGGWFSRTLGTSSNAPTSNPAKTSTPSITRVSGGAFGSSKPSAPIKTSTPPPTSASSRSSKK